MLPLSTRPTISPHVACSKRPPTAVVSLDIKSSTEPYQALYTIPRSQLHNQPLNATQWHACCADVCPSAPCVMPLYMMGVCEEGSQHAAAGWQPPCAAALLQTECYQETVNWGRLCVTGLVCCGLRWRGLGIKMRDIVMMPSSPPLFVKADARLSETGTGRCPSCLEILYDL